jgi:type IV fimbrial biogenesis protein FimT
MRLSAMASRGFTLVELMISLAILGFLLVLGIPNYMTWLADSEISNAAESIAGGLRYAQAQAVNQNQPVRFVLDPTTATGGWVVQLDGAGTTLQSGWFAQGSERAVFTVSPGGATTITYTGLGRVLLTNTDGSNPLFEVQVTLPGVAASRPLNVVFGAQGFTGIKVCDPAWPSTDPRGCPT